MDKNIEEIFDDNKFWSTNTYVTNNNQHSHKLNWKGTTESNNNYFPSNTNTNRLSIISRNNTYK